MRGHAYYNDGQIETEAEVETRPIPRRVLRLLACLIAALLCAGITVALALTLGTEGVFLSFLPDLIILIIVAIAEVE